MRDYAAAIALTLALLAGLLVIVTLAMGSGR